MAKGLEGRIKTDCLVIGGGGLAGFSNAWELAEEGKKVIVVEKSDSYTNSSSNSLAGGINSVSDESKLGLPPDSIDAFVRGALRNGSNLNCESVVRMCGERFYPDVIRWLEDTFDVRFDKGLHREGSDIARVHHISDHTGRDIMRKMYAKVSNHPNIQILTNHMAFDLVTENWINNIRMESDICKGAYVYDIKGKTVRTIEAEGVFVATGSLGAIFPAYSCPDTATGDGFGMAYRAHLPLVMMEMPQFHPTGLATPGNGKKPLCTQGLRGAGAFLKLNPDDTKDFIREKGYDRERGSDGPRSTVSRAISLEMLKDPNLRHVWLDCSPIKSDTLIKGYSDFYNACKENGYDPTKEPVPVRPILHYSNGGVLVGKHGETLYEGGRGIARLYFIGEDNYTGLHGADRFPSNSGPEAVLFGRRAAWHFLENKHPESKVKVPLWNKGDATKPKDAALMNYYIETIQNTMGNLCGIIRTSERLVDAKAMMAMLQNQIHGFYRRNLVDELSLTARGMLDVANPILDSALLRNSSIGCHYRADFPGHNLNHHAWSVVQKGREPYFMPIPK